MGVWAPALMLGLSLLACQAERYTDHAPDTEVDHTSQASSNNKWRNDINWNENRRRDNNDKSFNDNNWNENGHRANHDNNWKESRRWNNNDRSSIDNNWNKDSRRDNNDKSFNDNNWNENGHRENHDNNWKESRRWNNNDRSSIDNNWNKDSRRDNNDKSFNDNNWNENGHRANHDNNFKESRRWNKNDRSSIDNIRNENRRRDNKYKPKDEDRSIEKSHREYGHNDKEKYSPDHERGASDKNNRNYHCRQYKSNWKTSFSRSKSNKYNWKSRRQNLKSRKGRYYRRKGKDGKWWWCRDNRRSFVDGNYKERPNYPNHRTYPYNDHKNINWGNNHETNKEETHKNIPNYYKKNTNLKPVVDIVVRVHNLTENNLSYNQNSDRPPNTTDMKFEINYNPNRNVDQQHNFSTLKLNVSEHSFPDQHEHDPTNVPSQKGSNDHQSIFHTASNSQQTTKMEGTWPNNSDENGIKESDKQGETYIRGVTVNTLNKQQTNDPKQNGLYNMQPANKTDLRGPIDEQLHAKTENRKTEASSEPSLVGKESDGRGRDDGGTKGDDTKDDGINSDEYYDFYDEDHSQSVEISSKGE